MSSIPVPAQGACPAQGVTALTRHPLEAGGDCAPFDPLALARATERVVCRGDARKYSRFGFTHDYFWGVATGYLYGCCLRCVFCWASDTRDHATREARFCSPGEVVAELERIARRRRTRFARLSEGEPTIGKEHLLGVLDQVERSPHLRRFILETNGVLLGADADLVRALARFPKLWVRVALKAGTPAEWTRKTGATPESFPLPFEALRLLLEHGMRDRLSVAAMSLDPRFMSQRERVLLIAELAKVDPQLVLDLNEEMVVAHRTTLRRLAAAGYAVKRYVPVPGLWRLVQVSYHPVRRLGQKRLSARMSLSAIKNLFFGT